VDECPVDDDRIDVGDTCPFDQAGDGIRRVEPVREAIRMLESEGMFTFTPNIGAHVAVLDTSQGLPGSRGASPV